jgi:DNA-binding transcriptional regulator GbsR (MarR family)
MSEITPSMRSVIAHFAELGPRWGLSSETSAAHTLLYLSGRAMTAADLAQSFGWSEATAEAAIADLISWRMARRTRDGIAAAGGKPWDLLLAAFEERRRREIEPAVRVLSEAMQAAGRDGTPREARQRIRDLHALARDLSSIAERFGRVSSSTLTRLVGIGGRLSRIIGSSSRS